MDLERGLVQLPAGPGLRCARYVHLWGKRGGPCGKAAIAVVDGVPSCYSHAGGEARRDEATRRRNSA